MTVGDSTVDYDVVVIGSGFGGSVTALRLVEKGYRVGVLEAGRRFSDDEFAENSWHLRKYLWAPKLGCFGIQRMTLLKNTFLTSGAGVGGGSLTYANTLYEPPAAFFKDTQWGHLTDWQSELAPHYDQAKRMLGVQTNPLHTAADDARFGRWTDISAEASLNGTNSILRMHSMAIARDLNAACVDVLETAASTPVTYATSAEFMVKRSIAVICDRTACDPSALVLVVNPTDAPAFTETTPTNGATTTLHADQTRAIVRDHYGQIAKTGGSCAPGCCGWTPPGRCASAPRAGMSWRPWAAAPGRWRWPATAASR